MGAVYGKCDGGSLCSPIQTTIRNQYQGCLSSFFYILKYYLGLALIGTPGFPSHSNPYLRTKVRGFKILKILCVSFQPIPMATDVFWSRDPWQMAVFHVNCTFDQSIRIKPNFFAYSRSHKRSRPDCKNQEGCWCDLSLGSSRLLTFQPLLISWISESGQIKIHFIFWKSISMRIQHILLILFYIDMLQTSVRLDDVYVIRCYKHKASKHGFCLSKHIAPV